MIKAVLIDIDNTLLDFNASATLAMEESFLSHGLPFRPEMFKTFKRVNDSLWLKIEKNEITRAELHAVRFDLILKELGLNYDGKKIEKDFLSNLNHCAVKIDGAEDIMKYLSRKYVVCTASNAPTLQSKTRLAYSGLNKYVTREFISEEIGFAKPGKEFFDVCMNALSPIKKEETVMIGDSLTADIAGGVNYGLKTIWYNPNGENCGFGLFGEVKTLSALKKIL